MNRRGPRTASMRRFFASATIVLILALSGDALACQFDTDCKPGSKCLKSGGQINGVCAGGLQPGNENDRKPASDPLDPNRTVGKTCQFDTNCGPGSKCLKSSGSVYGTCMR